MSGVFLLVRELLNVRYWHLADITLAAWNVRFWGVKQTSRLSGLMSANDPKRTFKKEAPYLVLE